MRAAKVILLIWLLCELALWIRGSHSFCILDALPFAQRPEAFAPSYEWLALAAVMIGLWGYLMLPRAESAQPLGGGRFRTGAILVPAAIIGLALLGRRFRAAVGFSDLVSDPAKDLEHRHLALLCMGVFAVLLLIKALRNR